MPEVIVRKGEPVDRALKRLKNKLDAEGILEEVRRCAPSRPFTKASPQSKSQRQARSNQVPIQPILIISDCQHRNSSRARDLMSELRIAKLPTF